jgi:hypothetical protein
MKAYSPVKSVNKNTISPTKSPNIVASPAKSPKKNEKENYMPIDQSTSYRSRRSKGERKKSSGTVSQRKVENPEITLSQIHQIMLNPKNVEKEEF